MNAIDTNILVYAFSNQDPLRSRICIELLDSMDPDEIVLP